MAVFQKFISKMFAIGETFQTFAATRYIKTYGTHTGYTYIIPFKQGEWKVQIWYLQCGKYLIKDMEISLATLLSDHSSLLQQVGANVPAQRIPLEVKIDVHVFALHTNRQTFAHDC